MQKSDAIAARLAEAEARIRELEAKESEMKRSQVAREQELESELSKLRVPELPAAELTLAREAPLGQGSFKTAYLFQWKGHHVVKLKFNVFPCVVTWSFPFVDITVSTGRRFFVGDVSARIRSAPPAAARQCASSDGARAERACADHGMV